MGIGTLYRHFPTRDALVEEPTATRSEQLAESADELLADVPPDRALAAWIDRYVDYVAAKRGMIEALRRSPPRGPSSSRRRARRSAGRSPGCSRPGGAAGTLRRDLDADDVHRAIGGIWMIDGPGFREQAARLLGLVMDGLRAV